MAGTRTSPIDDGNLNRSFPGNPDGTPTRVTTLNRLSLESRWPQDVQDALAAAGHTLRVGLPWSEGRISACAQRRNAQGRRLLMAAANPRGMQG